MNKDFKEMIEELSQDIQGAYEDSPTIPEAEKLAGKFLYAQLQISDELMRSDLDARMKRAGTKAVKAAVYLEHATEGLKKPSDTMIGARVDSSDIVMGQIKAEAEADVERDWLKNHLEIFKEAHIFFRNLSKGSFQ